MNTTDKVMSWLEGLAEPDWREYHSDSEVQNIAVSALDLLKEHEEQIKNRDESLEKAREEIKWLREMLKEQETSNLYKCPNCGTWVSAENVVRCKDCKHRPKKPDWKTYEDGGDIEFPDEKCPCQCSSDKYYSWYPDDDWFCADGERK